MNLIPIPAFRDNYIWMLHDGVRAIVVDPGDAKPVLEALERDKLQLAAILVTHHHIDHTGGVTELHAATAAPVFGPAREAIPEPFEPLAEGNHLQALGLHFKVKDVPGHTAGHIAYFLPCSLLNATAGILAPLVFCGDTLFSGGCGRLFEGTPTQMLASLDALAALPDDTQVCCTHEYTLGNLRFAQFVEPDNEALADYVAHCQSLRNHGQPTLPSTLGLERRINPFLRTREVSVLRAVQDHMGLHVYAGDADVFAALRQWKNDFR